MYAKVSPLIAKSAHMQGARLFTIQARSQEEARKPGVHDHMVINARETLTLLLANNKDTYQPMHRRSLIEAFVIRYLKSKIIRSDIS